MVQLNKEFLKKLKPSNLKKDFFDLVSGISGNEIFIFLIFPTIVTMLMFLPSKIRESLSLKIYDYSLWQFFTHSFIHNDFNHLWHNLQGYFIFGIILLIFTNRTQGKNNLLWLFLITLISFPIMSSLIEIFIYPKIIPIVKISQGSSGLISAILGYLPMFLVSYFSEKQKHNLITINFFNICSLYIALLFAIIYYPYHKNLIFIFIFLTLLVLFALIYMRNLKRIFNGILEESKINIIFYFLLILMPSFFMILPIVLFPVNPIRANGIIDFFMHYIGFVYGVIISFVFFKIKSLRPASAKPKPLNTSK